MALTITKNDLDSVYGKTYTDIMKITKRDFEKVYGSSQPTPQPTKTETPKYGTVNGEIEIPYYIKNQGLYDLSKKTKFDYFADSVTKGAVGSIAQVGDSLKQSLTGETGKADRALYDFTMESAYNPSKANQLKSYIAQKQTADRNTSLNTDTFGYKMLDSSQKDMQKVTEGMSDTGRFLTNVAGSVVQNALVAPLAFINPSLAAGVMATSAAGHSIKQQADSGKTLKEANFRGAVDGLIEYGLGKIGIDSYLDNILGNGNVLKNIAKSALSEGSEESLSYLANYILDKISGDPDAKFDLKEFGLNTLAGGLAGGALGTGGAVVGSFGRNMAADPYYAAYSKAVESDFENGYNINKEGGYYGEETSSRHDAGRTERVRSRFDNNAERAEVSTDGEGIPKTWYRRKFRNISDKSSARERYERIVSSPKFYAKNISGEPIVVYHGTNVDFDNFKPSVKDLGIHFGTLKQAQSINERKNGHRIIAAQLDIKKPVYIDVDMFGMETVNGYFDLVFKTSDLSDWDVNYIKSHSGQYYSINEVLVEESQKEMPNIEKLNRILDKLDELEKEKNTFTVEEWCDKLNRGLEEDLKDLGYDAIVYHNNEEGDKIELSYAVFDNSRIKQVNKDFK